MNNTLIQKLKLIYLNSFRCIEYYFFIYFLNTKHKNHTYTHILASVKIINMRNIEQKN